MKTRSITRRAGFMLGAVLLGVIVLAAILAPWLAPHDPFGQDIGHRMVPPVWSSAGSWDNPLGTDKLGRDYLSRLFYGARVSLVVGLVVAMVAGLIGTSMGMAAGYFGGKVDAVISYLLTTRLAMPVVLVALATASLVGGSVTTVITMLSLLLWDRFAIVVRSAVRQLRSAEFVAAARVLGASHFYILMRELLPNIVGSLLVVATLETAHAILLESTLSFLGLGVQPPTPSWGLMVAEGKSYMLFQPWVILVPGVALVLLILSINVVGDGIRDLNAQGSER